MQKIIKILILEDVSEDLELILFELRRAEIKFNHFHVETEEEFRKGLIEFKPDLILSDYNLPNFNGLEALHITKKISLLIPFIVVTGSINEETAAKCIKSGAWDYVIKENLIRLAGAVNQALEKKALIETRIKAEKSLRISLENTRTILEKAPIGVLIIDRNRNIKMVNDATLKIAKVENIENILGKKCGEFLCPSQQNDCPILDKGQQIDNSERIFRRSDGTEIPILKTVTEICLDGEDVLLETLIDITKRKQAEEELISSEERLRILFEFAPDAYYLNDNKGIFVDGNKAAEDLLGYKKEELMGKSFLNLKLLSKKQFLKASKLLLKNIQGVRTGPDEVILNRKDGSSVTAEIRTFPVKIKGKTLVLGIARDITERKKTEEELKESEEKYRSLVETIEEGIAKVDLNETFTYANQAAADIFGYSKNEMIGKNLKEFTSPEMFQKVIEQTSGKAEKKSSIYELSITRKNGEQRIITVTATPIIMKTGEHQGTFGIFHDITDRKKVERLVKKELNEKNTLLKELYHRTKNNMQVISSMLRIQSQQSEDEFVHRSFKEIVDKIQAMALVHQKLYQAEDLSIINLKDYIKDILGILVQSYSVRSELFSYDLDLNDVFVTIDSAIPLGLVLNELISNVFKHSFPDNRKGKLTIKLEQEKSGDINIQLIDDGVGLPVDFNVEETESIGLQTVYSLITYQLNGSINYEVKDGLRWFIKFSDAQNKIRV